MSVDLDTSMAIVVSKKEDTYKIFTCRGLKVIATLKKFEVGDLIEIHQLTGNGMMVNCEKVL